MGRGIGAGLILRDQLFGGDGEGAGEIGHVVVEADGAPCHCGRFGCLETIAAAPAVLRAAAIAGIGRERRGAAPAAGVGGGTITATDDTPTLDDLALAAEAGDERAQTITRTAGRALGAAIAGLTGALDVRHVVVLGTMTRLGEPWFEAIRDEAARRSLGTLARETRIIDGGLGEDVTLLGACALLLTHELGLTVHR